LRVLGATTLDTFSGIGDMPIGMIQTYGMFMNDGTADDYFKSDYIVLWSANPVYTRIPDMHFLTEARYRGAELVVIGPTTTPPPSTRICGSTRRPNPTRRSHWPWRR